ncbi:hypothetical protein [Ilumatobacter sp.]|uniref:hypothetical protein n=1 Tax=Ilumatobacter sp. TaxID=1967498 RepID=UPI003B51B742
MTWTEQRLAQRAWRPGAADVFVHGEAAEVREARRHPVDVRGNDALAASISPYCR